MKWRLLLACRRPCGVVIGATSLQRNIAGDHGPLNEEALDD